MYHQYGSNDNGGVQRMAARRAALSVKSMTSRVNMARHRHGENNGSKINNGADANGAPSAFVSA